jgi:hypothetical protein
MNLLEIQEDLKDQTMDIVMGYANGTNPDVPPYLALAELNRRKRMESAAKTGTPPDGTVKDKLEKELTGQAADLMQAGAAKQAQSNQQLQQGLMAQPQPVPEGTPQPPQPEEEMPEMPQMAAGGLTTLPTRDMFKFAGGGGVVAFANGDVVEDKAKEELARAQLKGDREGMMDVVNKMKAAGYDVATLIPRGLAGAIDTALIRPARAMSGREIPYLGSMMDTSTPTPAMDELTRGQQTRAPNVPTSPNDQSAAETARLLRQNAGASGIASVAPSPALPPVAGPSGGGGIPAAIGMPKAPTFEKPDANAYETKLAAFKAANPGMAGSEFQKLLDKIAQQDEADRARFITQEKGRTRADFWKSLIDAGEATRGQKGIGALLGGFGRSAGASEAAAFDRADAQAKLRRDQEMGMAKMRAELEAARRAEARGDFEAAFKHKQDAEKIGRDLQQTEFANKMDMAKLQEQARGNSIQASTANRAPQLVQIAEDIQRKNPQMSPNEAMERAASYMASGQYQSSAQRQAKAVADALAEKTKMIDQQLSIIKPGSAEEKTLTTQRNKIIERFMADQRLLTGKSGTQDVNTPSPGFGTFKPVNPT